LNGIIQLLARPFEVALRQVAMGVGDRTGVIVRGVHLRQFLTRSLDLRGGRIALLLGGRLLELLHRRQRLAIRGCRIEVRLFQQVLQFCLRQLKRRLFVDDLGRLIDGGDGAVDVVLRVLPCIGLRVGAGRHCRTRAPQAPRPPKPQQQGSHQRNDQKRH